MNQPLRVGGRIVLPDGATMLWSMAEGRRGRRWRAMTASDGTTASDVLLETAPDGRPTRLEVATAAGLLTLHPDATGEGLHGNTVTTAGVRHHALPWASTNILLVDRSPLAEAAAVGPLAPRLPVGEGIWFGSVVVDGALVPRVGQTLVVRADESTFTLATPAVGEERTITIDARGLPTAGAIGLWQLEED